MIQYHGTKGFKELDRQLQQFPERVQRRLLGQAARAGAAVIRKRARNFAPVGEIEHKISKDETVKPGFLRKNIGISKKKTRKSRAIFNVGPLRAAYYGRFLEFGTIKMAAQPFLRPAFYGGLRQAIDAMRKKLAQRIEKEAAKGAKLLK